MIPNSLTNVLKLDGFVAFIDGYKGSGKTNLAMLLAELCHRLNLRNHFATNLLIQSEYIVQIADYPALEKWLMLRQGKKLYILDEAGKHIKRMRFMSQTNLKIMDLIQLIRHYDCGFIGIAPSAKFVDSSFLNTDILDLRITKISKKSAKVIDYYNNDSYFIHFLPKTSIVHNSKDIASFSMDSQTSIEELPTCCKIAKYMVMGWTRKNIETNLNLHPEQYRRELKKHLRHTLNSQFTNNHEVKEQEICEEMNEKR